MDYMKAVKERLEELGEKAFMVDAKPGQSFCRTDSGGTGARAGLWLLSVRRTMARRQELATRHSWSSSTRMKTSCQ